MIPACPGPRAAAAENPPPPEACDTHRHVFGPADRFPYAEDRSYTPPDAPLKKYLGMLDTLGFARGVLVQGSAHGRDNSAMLDALARTPDRLRGVAVADERLPAAELRRWDALGMRGAALQSFLPRRAVALSRRRDAGNGEEAQLRDEGALLASATLDRLKDMPDTIPILDAIGLPVVIDHMGRTDARAGTGTPGFQSLLRSSATAAAW